MAPSSVFVFITSFYSGRTYRIDLGPVPSASNKNNNNNNVSITFGALLGLLRSHWKHANYKSSINNVNAAVAENNNNNNTTSTTPQQNSQQQQSPPPTMDLLLADTVSPSSTAFVAASDAIPNDLLFFDSPHQNLLTSQNHNHRLLYLLYKPAHRENMERLLMDRTTLHPQDLSPSPANQVEKGTIALLSIFTHLSAKARQEVEALLAQIDSARTIMDDYEATLDEDVKNVRKLRDGEVAAEISVTSKESLAEFVGDVRSNLERATSVVSDFQFPATIHGLLMANTSITSSSSAASGGLSASNVSSPLVMGSNLAGAGGAGGIDSSSSSSSKFSPDRCYDAAAAARKELNDMTKQLAHANELITAVFEQYFPRFESLRALPESYPVAEEIARRRVDLYQACTRIQNQLSGEAMSIQESIAGFVQQYGSRFPQNVLRGLDAPIPALHVAYEPLIKTVPVSVDGGTALLKKFGLFCSHLHHHHHHQTINNGNANNTNDSSSTPESTQPPSPNTANTATFSISSNSSPPNENHNSNSRSLTNNNNNNKAQTSNNNSSNGTTSNSRQQSVVWRDEMSTNNNNNNTDNTPANTALSIDDVVAEVEEAEKKYPFLPPATATAESAANSNSSTNIAIENILQLVKLSEQETEIRRNLEFEASEERLDVTSLRAVEEKSFFSASTANSSNANNNSNNYNSQRSFALPTSGGVTSSNLTTMSSSPENVSTATSNSVPQINSNNNNNNNNKASSSNFLSLGNFFKGAEANNNNNNSKSSSSSSSEISSHLYSQAVSFDISRCVTLWNLGEPTYQNQVRAELTAMLSKATLDFQKPIAERPAFAIVLGGMFKVIWTSTNSSQSSSATTGEGGDSSSSSTSSSSKIKGRVVVVNDLKMAHDNNDDDKTNNNNRHGKNGNDDDDDQNDQQKPRGRGRPRKNSGGSGNPQVIIEKRDGASMMNELIALMPFAELICEVRKV